MPIEINGKIFYTTKEAAEYAGTSRATLYTLKEAGKLHQYKKGFSRIVYWSKEELDEIKGLHQVDNNHS